MQLSRSRKIVMILDNARIHHAKADTAFLQNIRLDRARVFYLPIAL
ncbi:hypothetical protein CW304_12100 [Bacillus sp. UFRGS-B20]|nr:hypothetical protein CW304_12100 [Bacillus sp. UFRGS-B20]